MCTAPSRGPARPMRRSSPSCRPPSRWSYQKARRTTSRCRVARCATSTPPRDRGARHDASSPADVCRPRGGPGRRDARPGPGLRDPAGRGPVRVCDPARLQQCDCRQSQLRVGRPQQLSRDPRRPDLPAGAPQQCGGDGRLAGARSDPRNCRRPSVPRHVSRQALRPVRATVAMGGAGVARGDRVDVDLRFHVQRDQLDAQSGRPAPRLAVLAGRSGTRALRHHHRAGVAHLSVRDRDRAGGAVVDPAGDRRGSHCGRRRILAAAVSRRAPTVAAGGGCGGAVRRGVHRDRPGRRLHPDGRRAGQHDARVTHSGVPAWHPGCRLRTGCCDRRVPAPLPDRRRHWDAAAGPPHGGGGSAMKRVALYAAALGIVVFAGFPFYWMLVTSFKQNRDLYVGASDLSHIPWIFNDPPTLEHVKLLLGQTDFPRWVLNTLVVVVAVVVITVAVAVPAGYSLARLVGRWGERMGMGIFFTYLIPPTLLFVPFSRLISLLHLQDSLGALILIYPTMTIPFCTWLVMGFLRSVPW